MNDTTSYTFVVTEEHVRRAEELRAAARAKNAFYPAAHCCPVALALHDAGFADAMVGRDEIIDADGTTRTDLPESLYTLVGWFDTRDPNRYPKPTLPIAVSNLPKGWQIT